MAYEGDQIYFGDQQLEKDTDDFKVKNIDVQRKFTKFIMEWSINGEFIYKDQLKNNIALNRLFIKVDLGEMEKFDYDMTQLIRNHPVSYMPILEQAVNISYETIHPTEEGQTPLAIQLQISSNEEAQPLRNLKSTNLGKLVNINGIIINAGKTILRGKKVVARCKGCGHEKVYYLASGFEGVNLPLFCESRREQRNGEGISCPRDPYQVLPDYSEFIDFQILKIQECPDAIPTGEVPRTYPVCCERYLVDRLVPGTRVVISGVYTVSERRVEFGQPGLKLPYIICYSYSSESSGSRRVASNFSSADTERFEKYGKEPDIYKKISESVGDAIFGHEDIKKAIACLLFGGSTKILPDKSKLRGDINILLLGDPSTAKSQFLKFVQRVAPISVYTSGKGSSAAGLTAAIIKDPHSGEFQLEGGALVLADGGVVCIDEFDKMRPQDRVAIHEAMEQQTISVAKAGITTILNSRTSVLAAANPIFGRYDDQKKVSDQIDLQTTILSRFDCIFIVRDIRNEEADKRLAKHIIGLHSRANLNRNNDSSGSNFNINELKNYIMYAKMNVSPRMNEEAAVTLQNLYIEDRKHVKNMKQDKKSHIPITVRQLEAIIRLSEAIAKMRLCHEVTRADVEEAHKLFKVSTMNAIKGFSSIGVASTNPELLIKIEESIKRRVDINARISRDKLVEELEMRYTNTSAVLHAINNLLAREEFDSIQEGRTLLRKK